MLFGSKVLSAQDQHFRWFPSLLCFPVLFGSNVFFHSKFSVLGGFLHSCGSYCCFAPCLFHPKSIFWVVPFTFHGLFGSDVFSTQNNILSGVLHFSWFFVFASKVFLLEINIWVIPVLFLWFPVLFSFKISYFIVVVTSVVKYQRMVSKDFLSLFQSDSHNIIMIELNGIFHNFLAKTHSETNNVLSIILNPSNFISLLGADMKPMS